MWLVGSTRPVIRLRLVSRLLLKSGQLVSRLLLSNGSTRLVIRLRTVSRLLIKSDWWVGQSVGCLRLKEGLSVVYTPGWCRLGWRYADSLENWIWLGEHL